MTIVFSETWTGTNGAAWPAQWTSASAACTIQSNAGKMLAPTFGNAVSAYAPLSPTLADCELFCTFTPDASAISATTSFLVSLRADGAGTLTAGFPPTTGVTWQLTSTGTNSYSRTVGGTTTFTASGTALGASWVAGTVYGVRIHAVGTHVQFRLWDTGSAEPGTWTLDNTNASTPISAGSIRLSYTGSGSSTRFVSVDDLTVDDLAVAAASPSSVRTVNRVPLIRSANF